MTVLRCVRPSSSLPLVHTKCSTLLPRPVCRVPLSLSCLSERRIDNQEGGMCELKAFFAEHLN